MIHLKYLIIIFIKTFKKENYLIFFFFKLLNSAIKQNNKKNQKYQKLKDLKVRQ